MCFKNTLIGLTTGALSLIYGCGMQNSSFIGDSQLQVYERTQSTSENQPNTSAPIDVFQDGSLLIYPSETNLATEEVAKILDTTVGLKSLQSAVYIEASHASGSDSLVGSLNIPLPTAEGIIKNQSDQGNLQLTSVGIKLKSDDTSLVPKFLGILYHIVNSFGNSSIGFISSKSIKLIDGKITIPYYGNGVYQIILANDESFQSSNRFAIANIAPSKQTYTIKFENRASDQIYLNEDPVVKEAQTKTKIIGVSETDPALSQIPTVNKVYPSQNTTDQDVEEEVQESEQQPEQTVENSEPEPEIQDEPMPPVVNHSIIKNQFANMQPDSYGIYRILITVNWNQAGWVQKHAMIASINRVVETLGLTNYFKIEYLGFSRFASLKFETLKKYAMILVSDGGSTDAQNDEKINDSLVTIFGDLHQAGVPLFFVGNDFSYVGTKYIIDEAKKQMWSHLTGLAIAKQPIDQLPNGLFNVSFADHPIIKGRFGAVGPFEYSKEIDLTTQTANTPHQVLMTGRDTSPALLVNAGDENVGPVITQQFLMRELDETSIPGTILPFENMAYWLLKHIAEVKSLPISDPAIQLPTFDPNIELPMIDPDMELPIIQ